jgi:Tol biopolymer transport system component
MRSVGSIARESFFVVAGISLWLISPSANPAAQTQNGAPASGGDSGLPLKDTHKLEFTVNEGTWISLDVTPDGKSIVFDLLGDLYRLPIAGGKAERITEGLAYDREPRVSPDGKWIAFISDRSGISNLWIKSLVNDEMRMLTNSIVPPPINGFSPEGPMVPMWSPDSQSVLASASVTGKLTIYRIDGGEGVPLSGGLNTEGYRSIEGFFDPTGRYVCGPHGRQIVRWDLESGKETEITHVEIGSKAFSPLLSPRGDVLIYMTRDYYDAKKVLIHRMDLRSGEEKVISDTDMHEVLFYPAHSMPGYAFTPDGGSLLLETNGKIRRIDVNSGASMEIPFTADVSIKVGRKLYFPGKFDQGPVKARIVQDPHLSPDGKTLAFSLLTKIYTVSFPGGEPKRLTNRDAWEFKPAWSPDGQWIAYVTWSLDGGHIWKIRVDGQGQPRRLTEHAAFYTGVSFSPDGEKIVAIRDSTSVLERHPFSEFLVGRETDPPLEVIWLPSSGGEPRVVTKTGAMTSPHFAGDSQHVYFGAAKGMDSARKDSLLSMGLDGGDQRELLSFSNPGAKDPYYDKTFELSPDGKWALVRAREQLYVAAVPRIGATGPEIEITAPPFPSARLTDIGVDYFSWADGGKTITWAIGSTFYKRPLASVDFSTAARAKAVSLKVLEEDSAVEKFAINMTFPRATPKGAIALRHATVVSMDGDTVIPDADLVIQDNRIAAVGRSGQVAIPHGAKEQDLRGKFIVPGFVDTHAHWLTLKEYNIVEPQSWDLQANLAYGVTTSMDVQTSSDDSFVYEDLAAIGQSLAPRLVSTGPGVRIGDAPFGSYEETYDYLRRFKDHFNVRYVKAYEPGPRKPSEWFVNAARELGLMVSVHPRIDRPFDGFSSYEHELPMFPLHADTIELFARTQIGVNPTLIAGAVLGYFEEMKLDTDRKYNHFTPPNFLAKNTEESYFGSMHNYIMNMRDRSSLLSAQIRRAGGLIGVGSHGNWPGIQYHMEMWALGIHMTAGEVLRAATIDGAKILGLDQEVGSIKTGKLADLLILDKNPLENVRNSLSIRYVMRNGELYEGDTLKEIWPVAKEAPSFWWQEAASHALK